jgi:hypothetical protein
MPRFYFHLASKDSHTTDENGKELATLNDAYAHARKLIDKILYHVGSDDAKAWKIVISNDENDARIIVPFPISCSFPAQREAVSRKYLDPLSKLGTHGTSVPDVSKTLIEDGIRQAIKDGFLKRKSSG